MSLFNSISKSLKLLDSIEDDSQILVRKEYLNGLLIMLGLKKPLDENEK